MCRLTAAKAATIFYKKLIKKVLLIVPPLVNLEEGKSSPDRLDFEAYRLVSPVEPTSVAADLLSRGFEVKIFDLGAYETGKLQKLSRFISDFTPDAAVIVQSILTFATAQDWDGQPAFDLVRGHSPRAVTVLTGGHATNYHGDAVKRGVCDFSIRGESDFAVGDLLERLNRGSALSGLAGLAFRTAGGELCLSDAYPEVELSKLPLPAYHVFDAGQLSRYSQMLERGKIRFPEKSARYRDIMTSRSCVLRCSFCSVAHLRGERQKYRRKPLENVIPEIEQALEQGVEEIHFFDDLFAENEKQILAFTDALRKRNLRFNWFVAQGMPLWPLTAEAVAAMKETGMYRIICPLESGSDRVLKRVVGKAYSTVEHYARALAWASDAGLEIIGMFVVGMPGETRSEILDTLRFAEDHPEIDYSVFSIATPMVGTRLMRQVTERGQLGDADKINRVIKRTVALYRTEEFAEYELGVIRAFDWDRINFGSPERKRKYARMVGVTPEELDALRDHSKQTFYRFFPDYNGPLSFKELYDKTGLFAKLEPVIPDRLY